MINEKNSWQGAARFLANGAPVTKTRIRCAPTGSRLVVSRLHWSPPTPETMLKKAFLVLVALALGTGVAGFSLYLTNRAPTVPPVPAAEIANPTRPYVVKLHAQWCSLCIVTKGVWGQIEETYAGRVNLVVLDFTNDANTNASRIEAKRLGLESFFEEYGGATGTIVVLSATKQVTAEIKGSRDFAEYRTAIDATLAAGLPRSTP